MVWLRTLGFYLLVMPYAYLCVGFCLVVSFIPGTFPFVYWFERRVWAPGWMWLSGVKVTLSGSTDQLQTDQSYIFVSNHQGHFDIPALKAAFSQHTVLFITKRSLLYVPITGLYLWRMGYPLVNRKNPEQARQILDRATEQVRRGTSMVVFAEGTRTTSGEIGEFKGGAFVMAIESQRPIIPVTISGSMAVMGRDSVAVRSGQIHIHLGEVIPTQGLELDDKWALSQSVREKLLSQYEIQRTASDRLV